MIKSYSAFAALAICATMPAFAAKPLVVLAEKVQQQKIKHPTEAMSKEEHTAILNNMRQKKNDAEKIAALKEGVKDKGITVEQLITLLNQFLTDDAKIECAQYAFPYTTNYKAFLKIMDLFQQEGYKWRLEEYYDKNRK
ncbi:DUF4476 domain-containing protein [Mucilaginibacter calamicampi]|uniref:DUF4476 domain-containing protein n=1 Tax=Mucilaginibacter calamicampi TaxID=1302352 RepID=A0ABW2Z1N5_9SPHI